MPFKTTVTWLFNYIWCYLAIGFFDWKIGIFQQAVVSIVSLSKALMYEFHYDYIKNKCGNNSRIIHKHW